MKLSSDYLKQSVLLEDVNIDGIIKLTFEKGLRWEVERDGAVGTVSRHGLDGTGSNPGGGEISAPVQIGLGAHPAFCTMGTGSFSRVRQPRR